MRREAVERKLAEVVHKIVKEFHPQQIILFGSWAWGTPGPDSDVDLFIVQETENTRRLAAEIDGSIFPRPFPIDLIVCRPQQLKKRLDQGDFFAAEVLRKGKILYAA
ncbi:MAG: hypothetical protein A3G87_06885 [Omnitrophica bacterium RIFCSPLOWO2_12_FULL_50_11]|nr:MAG: hypothetical protein A3G87_06885 [Omnitrophica bacterium RIFCSPLOWO2_12_FULL_50_11]